MGTIVQYAAGAVSLVCLILVIVKLFQAKQTVLGIISIVICGIGGYICGWIKAKELGLKNIMLIWTGAWILSIISIFLPGGALEQMKKMSELQESAPSLVAPPTPATQ